ncbi:PXDN [Branchiostoma lanceolatum]|uniref:PXDN protein n=1 Tax=Branchiostoma lanceolatum TaxID=7740 RepID=A0A8J9ZG71_BRALA|nr:PXDN [Branchiostoma lanceolatum]
MSGGTKKTKKEKKPVVPTVTEEPQAPVTEPPTVTSVWTDFSFPTGGYEAQNDQAVGEARNRHSKIDARRKPSLLQRVVTSIEDGESSQREREKEINANFVAYMSDAKPVEQEESISEKLSKFMGKHDVDESDPQGTGDSEPNTFTVTYHGGNVIVDGQHTGNSNLQHESSSAETSTNSNARKKVERTGRVSNTYRVTYEGSPDDQVTSTGNSKKIRTESGQTSSSGHLAVKKVERAPTGSNSFVVTYEEEDPTSPPSHDAKKATLSSHPQTQLSENESSSNEEGRAEPRTYQVTYRDGRIVTKVVGQSETSQSNNEEHSRTYGQIAEIVSGESSDNRPEPVSRSANNEETPAQMRARIAQMYNLQIQRSLDNRNREQLRLQLANQRHTAGNRATILSRPVTPGGQSTQTTSRTPQRNGGGHLHRLLGRQDIRGNPQTQTGQTSHSQNSERSQDQRHESQGSENEQPRARNQLRHNRRGHGEQVSIQHGEIANILGESEDGAVGNSNDPTADAASSEEKEEHAPPRITTLPQDADVVEGTSVEFECAAEGHPTPVIVWTVNGNQLPDDRRFTVLSSGMLRISRVTSYDRGTYECQAVNVASVDRARADLTVKARVTPTFTETPTDLSVQAGGEVTLPCSAVGEPQPAITWNKDGIQITGMFFTESSKYGLSAIGHLIIRGVDQSDTGRYECSARNTIGFASTSMQFTVLVPETNNFIGDPFVGPSIQQAINSVDRAINTTRNDLFSRTPRPRTPSELLQLMRFPSPEALSLARAAEVFERTLQLVRQEVQQGMKLNLEDSEYSYTELISPSHLRLVANLSGCSTHQQIVNCSDRICFHQRYRSFDGTCNNFQHPMWGAALTPFRRLLKPIYENGFNTPVGWNRSHLYFGFSKPSSRGVSTGVLSTSTTTPDTRYSHMVMQWGQFLDHDLDLAVESSSEVTFSTGLRCNETCENTPPCFPIEIPRGDPRIRNSRCMEFRRSSAVCGTGSTSLFFNEVTPREQINTLTSFLDASNVYGSNDLYATQIRDLTNQQGLLKGGIRQANGKYLLPFNTELPIDCQRGQHDSPIPCFLAGDVRSNEQLGLLTMHTLWMREHNRIAKELQRLNPHWDGDTIYHEGRKIVGAEMQHISFNHWMPKFVGQKGMELIGEYQGYDPNTNPSIINAFATAAYRIGHTLINPMIFRLNASFQEIPEGHLPLHQAFFSPQRVVDEGGIDPVLRGLFATPLKQRNSREFVNTELTERLFEMAHHIALDLAALNIQRGRDHALPGYNDWRVLCNMTAVNDWDSLRHQISDAQLRDRLRQLYGHPGNLDLFVAGAVEDLVPGSLLGPTFLCIITQQFRNIRNGDRFWYENPGVFKPSQLTQIKQTSLARVLCDNGDSIDRVQRDVFVNAEFPTGYVYCDSIPRMDLTAWTECCEDCANSAEFGTVSGQFRKRRSTRYSELSDAMNFMETAKQRRKTAKLGKQEEFVAMKHKKSKQRLAKPNHDRIDVTVVSEYHASGQNVSTESDRMSRLEYGMMMMQDIAGDLQRAVSQLTRKVREFEVQLEHLQTCKDEEGNRYRDGDTWDPDDCTSCRCQEGKATCVRQKCPEKSCAKPLLIPGECCPVCV